MIGFLLIVLAVVVGNIVTKILDARKISNKIIDKIEKN